MVEIEKPMSTASTSKPAPATRRALPDRPVLFGVLWAFATALLGAALTEIGPWYQALNKPSWQPPDWAFGPAWTTIFALSTVAFVLAWRRGPEASRPALLAVYAVNAVCNAGWSLLFFTIKRPDWALWETIPLAASVTAMMLVAGRHSKASAWLLVPYLAWVLFATYLNWTILRLNPAG